MDNQTFPQEKYYSPASWEEKVLCFSFSFNIIGKFTKGKDVKERNKEREKHLSRRCRPREDGEASQHKEKSPFLPLSQSSPLSPS